MLDSRLEELVKEERIQKHAVDIQHQLVDMIVRSQIRDIATQLFEEVFVHQCFSDSLSLSLCDTDTLSFASQSRKILNTASSLLVSAIAVLIFLEYQQLSLLTCDITCRILWSPG